MLLKTSRVLFNSLLKREFHALPTAEKFVITPEIKEAILNNGPVVALESTIISHGKEECEMPGSKVCLLTFFFLPK